MRIVYADSLCALNFVIDYLLLLATGKICALPLMRRRMALGALWGGLYALLATLYPAFFALAAVKLGAGLISAAIAYGGKGPFLRTAVVFLSVSAAFGGAVQAALNLGGGSSGAISLSMRSLVLSFALCYAALSLVFRGMGRRGTREKTVISVTLMGRSTHFGALRDNGNELLDSTGNPVITAQWSAVAPLFPEITNFIPDPVEMCLLLTALSGMEGRCRLVSCLTATGSGMMAAFRPDSIATEASALPHKLIAICPGPLSPNGDFEALY